MNAGARSREDPGRGNPDRGRRASRETVGAVGEFALIRRIRRVLEEGRPRLSSSPGPPSGGVVLGVGDDAAVVRPEPGWDWVLTCDVQVAGRHFLPDWMDAGAVGRRAMMVNLSDLAAMGAEPRHALVSLGLPAEMEVADVEELYRGFRGALDGTGATVVGGNITATGPEWFCDLTLIGRVEEGRPLARAGARAGDRILVTGSPGRSAAGLAVLHHLAGTTSALRLGFDHQVLSDNREKLNRFVRDEPWARALVEAFRSPTARLAAGRRLALDPSNRVTAAIDVSDGLYGDCLRLCESSRVAAVLDTGLLPPDPDLERAARFFGQERRAWSLLPSDDYELLFTARAEAAAAIQEALRVTCGLEATMVGEITASVGSEGEAKVSVRGMPEDFRPGGGWDHFRRGGIPA